jgi:hypothetical protein
LWFQDGVIYVLDSNETPFASVTVEKWAKAAKWPMPKTRDAFRHFALDVVAAAAVGEGGRKRTVDQEVRVVTLDESSGRRDNHAATLTLERGYAFGILRDATIPRCYRVEIFMFTPGEVKRFRWFHSAPSQTIPLQPVGTLDARPQPQPPPSR